MAINIAGNTVINDVGRFFLPSVLNETKVAMGANDIDLATGSAFTKTISGATSFTVSNTPVSGKVGSFILEITTTVASPVITWWTGVKWAGGIAPTLPNINTPNSFAFYTHDGGTTWNGMLIGKNFYNIVGESIYTAEGTFSFVVPTGVTDISAVCVGGGGGGGGYSGGNGHGAGGGALAWKNNFAVTPGETLTVDCGTRGLPDGTQADTVGGNASIKRGATTLVLAVGNPGTGYTYNTDPANAALCIGDAAYSSGGSGQSSGWMVGGGGAGGYSGSGGGGSGLTTVGSASSGGGGGGGCGSGSFSAGGGGGGVGLYGAGANGAAGTIGAGTNGGGGGSGGSGGGSTTGGAANGGQGGLYGGGGGGGYGGVGGQGGNTAIRIIWGPGRSFPNNAA